MKSYSVVTMMSVGSLILSIGVASGQGFPNKPIRIVASAPGGAGDVALRQIVPGLTERLGQPVIVDNRGGVLGDIVVKAPPNGYTLIVDAGGFWLSPLIQKMNYDPVRDFSPITVLTASPNILVVHPSVPANSVKELIALAKAKPGQLNYGSAPTGSGSHLAMELFKSMTGVKFEHIPYKGSGPAVIDLIGGQIQLMIASAPSVTPQIKSGKLRALAVTSVEPSALAPGLPTVAASGVPGYEMVTVIAILAPAGTPRPVIQRLNQDIVRSLRNADVKEKLFNVGSEVVGNSPEEFAATLKSEIAKWTKVVKEAGIKAD